MPGVAKLRPGSTTCPKSSAGTSTGVYGLPFAIIWTVPVGVPTDPETSTVTVVVCVVLMLVLDKDSVVELAAGVG